MYHFVIYGLTEPGARVTETFQSPDIALDLFEEVSRRVLQAAGAKVQLLDGDKVVSEVTASCSLH